MCIIKYIMCITHHGDFCGHIVSLGLLFPVPYMWTLPDVQPFSV
jgi:hypothetical protein